MTHGYNLDPLGSRLTENPRQTDDPRTPIQRAENMVTKLKDATDFAQMAMASAQQLQEEYANRNRDPAEQFNIGDKVWLDLRNIKTDRPSKKLDARQRKFTVMEKIGSHAYRLDITGVHPVFHVRLLRPAAADPFPSQITDSGVPPAILVDGHEEWEVEEILDERTIDGNSDEGPIKEYKVKWVGDPKTYWDRAEHFSETAALDRYEHRIAARADRAARRVRFRD